MSKTFNNKDITDRIKNELYNQHISQVQLAEWLDVSSSTVNKYLNGKLALSLETTVQIAEELGMDLNDLVYGEAKKIPGLDVALKYLRRAEWEIKRLSK